MKVELFDDDGNPVDVELGQFAEALSQAAPGLVGQGPSIQSQRLSGRSLLVSGRWYGPNNNWGPAYPVYSQFLATGEVPVVPWTARGFAVREGDEVISYYMTGRENSGQASAIKASLVFITGDWDGDWGSNDETSQEVAITAVVDSRGESRDRRRGETVLERPFSTPSDGILVPVFAPEGPLTGTRTFFFEGEFLVRRSS